MAIWIEIGVKCRFGCHLRRVLRTRGWVTSPKEGRQYDWRAPRKSRKSTSIPESWRSRRRGPWRRGRRKPGGGRHHGRRVEEEQWSVTRVPQRACSRHTNLSFSMSSSDIFIVTSRKHSGGWGGDSQEEWEWEWIKLSSQPRLQEGKLVCLCVDWFIYFLLTEERWVSLVAQW